MRRKPQNSYKAARAFNKSTSRTKRINVTPPAARGGYRL